MEKIEIAKGFAIEVDEDDVGYQLVGPGGEESGVVDYGEDAEVEVDGKTYMVTVEDKATAMSEETNLYLCLAEVPTVVEEEFDLEGEEDEDAGDLEGVTE